ncbi:Hypothetical predicted protein [Pelobates cultripes]|uniref:Uncharacterized protein n=1 Tax=Pelobates cultripes TaxID=61616 RepID=A0AAD1S556_PELCU|nr:Hypothetical predicted protein [Pelobates cultripes]
MSHHKGKKNPAKAEKHNFFQQKPHSAASGLQNTTPDSDEGSDDESIAQNHPEPGEALTKGYLAQALEALSQKLIGSWKNSMDSLRRDVQEIGKRTSHIESKMEEDAAAHNDLATHVESLEEKLLLTESKLADMEDRSRRNNLPLRGVPEQLGGYYEPMLPKSQLISYCWRGCPECRVHATFLTPHPGMSYCVHTIIMSKNTSYTPAGTNRSRQRTMLQ